MRFSTVAATAALSAVAHASPIDYEIPQVEAHAIMARQASSLKQAMENAGREFMGVAVTLRGSSTEENIIKAQFDSITPENAMKWDATEPSRGNFNFGNGDQIANFARSNGMQLHCHTLVWHSQLPSWVASGSWTSSSLQSVMKSHIDNVAGRWRGSCTRWDVVNEALNEDGSYRDSVFYRVLGENFIPISFRLAAAADPNAELYYNDYNLAYGNAKTQGAARIVRLVQNAGARIDGVGFQAHMTSESTNTNQTPTPSTQVLAAALKSIADLGVDVAYTEIDIRMNTPVTNAKTQAAAAAWGRMASACLSVPRCVGMTVWGVSDQYSWVPSTFNGEGSALLWDNNFQVKPQYTAFYNAIASASSNPVTSTTTTSSTTTQPPTTTTTTSSSTTTSTTTTTTQTPPPGGCSAIWGQCGGLYWSGPTCCQSGTTCQYQNDWYSQCL